MAKSNVSNKADRKPNERLDPASRGNTKTEAAEAKGLIGFFRNTRAEFDKVVWPSRQQLISESVAVLMIVVIFTLFISLMDQAYGWVAQQLFKA